VAIYMYITFGTKGWNGEYNICRDHQ